MQERPYICGMCGDTFALSDDLHIHTASHSNTSIMRPSFDHPGPSSPITQSALGTSSPLHLLRAPSVTRIPSMTRSSSTQSLAPSSSATAPSFSSGGGQSKRSRSPEAELSSLPVHHVKRLAVSQNSGGYVALAKSKSLTELQGQDTLYGEGALDSEKSAERSSTLMVPSVFQRARSLEGAVTGASLMGNLSQRKEISASSDLMRSSERTGIVSMEKTDSGSILKAALQFSQGNFGMIRPVSPLPTDSTKVCVQVSQGLIAAETVSASEAASSNLYREKLQLPTLTVSSPQILQDVTQGYRNQVDPREHRLSATERMGANIVQNNNSRVNSPNAVPSNIREPLTERRQQSCERKGSERTGHERRPTICRQEEIELGDQELAAVDSIVDGDSNDTDDDIFDDRTRSLEVQSENLATVPLMLVVKTNAASDKVTVNHGVDQWPTKNVPTKGTVGTEVQLVPRSQDSSYPEKALSPYQAPVVSPTASVYCSNSMVVSTSSLSGSSQQQDYAFPRYQTVPSGVGVEYERSLGSMYHSLHTSRTPCSSAHPQLEEAADTDYRHQPSSHHDLPGAADFKSHHHHNQPEHILAMRLQEEEEMDSEVQSYFSNHLHGSSSQDIASAILMNDGDSDDPQLLVCEEEMGDSGKDNTSDDMEDGAMAEGGEQNLGSKSGEWDDWTLSVEMQPAETEADLLTSQ